MYASKIITLVVLVVAINVVYCESDLDTLKQQLFAKNAPILPKEKVIELLQQIKPLLPEKSDNINEVDQKEVSNLLRISEKIDHYCNNENQFSNFYPARRTYMKGNGYDSGAEDWNDNIDNYVIQCLSEQFKVCSDQFIKSIESTPEGMKYADKLLSQVEKNDYSYNGINDYTKEIILPLLPKKKTNLFTSLEKSIKNSFMDEFLHIESSCYDLRNNAKNKFLMLWAVENWYVEALKLKADEKLMRHINQYKICLAFHQAAHPVSHNRFFQRDSSAVTILNEILTAY